MRPSRRILVIPDVRGEAEFLRAALLVGLLRAQDVAAWAEQLLPILSDENGRLTEVMLAPLELTALREALRPLGQPSQPLDAGLLVLSFMALDPDSASLGVADQVLVLSLLRREEMFAPAAASQIKLFEDRLMLASGNVAGEAAPSREEVGAWLDAVRPPSYFRFVFEREDETGAFLGALSRKVVRDRRMHHGPRANGPRAWIVRREDDHRVGLILNETLWRVALREFSPLPVGSRLPYCALPTDAELVLDQDDARPMGLDEALVRISGW
ncbi:MAG TPA: hypothetical protein VHE78_12020 [Gemmatimonadaceae bacterium]|nr:hypothetical protein [Gemmatimonadaceae bacterium]